jgi:hypothetical protein
MFERSRRKEEDGAHYLMRALSLDALFFFLAHHVG